MRTVVICQARMGSTRFPGKVMKPLAGGEPLMAWTVHAAKKAHGVDQVVVATSSLKQDDPIVEWCVSNGVAVFRGSEDDVLARCYEAAKYFKADIVVRLTCDCPFIDPYVLSDVIRLRALHNADYASNIDPPSFPDGLDVEVMTFAAIEAAHKEATTKIDRDCWPQFIFRNRSRFKAVNLRCPIPLQDERWVCDTEADYEFCLKVSQDAWNGPLSYQEILSVLDRNPEWRKINDDGVRNERFYEGLAREKLPPRTFERSNRILERARRTIPFGAQTFSKSHIQFPAGRAPLYCSHGDGARLFDVDGNDYVDLVNAVLPVVLGYRDPDVDEAIRRQLDNGISFSLATELEYQLAELLKKHIPSAEMVKFGKSGTDVTTAAVRLARAKTGRDLVLLSGYHGWSDWSMAPTDRNLGIPKDVQALTRRFTYGDMYAVSKVPPSRVAAVIVEPNGDKLFLETLREYCTKHGIVLIFDEIITGFRYDMGGAQKLFNVTPDLSTFGKAMANGMPISAIVGKKEIMKLMEPPDNIFYSGTMFGETLSIAAAIATIEKLERLDVVPWLWKAGEAIQMDAQRVIDAHKISTAITLHGLPPRVTLSFHDQNEATADQIRTLFMMEMIQNGVLIINSHNVSFSFGPNERERVFRAYEATADRISEGLRRGNIADQVGEIVKAAPLRATA